MSTPRRTGWQHLNHKNYRETLQLRIIPHVAGPCQAFLRLPGLSQGIGSYEKTLLQDCILNPAFFHFLSFVIVRLPRTENQGYPMNCEETCCWKAVEYLKTGSVCGIIQKVVLCEKPVENFFSTDFPRCFPPNLR